MYDLLPGIASSTKFSAVGMSKNFGGIYAPTNVCVKDIDSWASVILQNYQNFIELTSNMIYIVALGVGLKCPCKIDLNTQWGRG